MIKTKFFIKTKEFPIGYYSIDHGKLNTPYSIIRLIFDKMDKTITPEMGESDFVLADRINQYLGPEIITQNVVEVPEESDPEIIY